MGFHVRHLADDAATAQLGGEIARWLVEGDFVALEGDLGAGKTALARAILRTLAGDEALEVPSPTFTLVQTYDTGPLAVGHFDLYRLEHADDLEELGLDAALEDGAVLVEWPSRLGGNVPGDRLEVHLTATPDGGRQATLSGHGVWHQRLARQDRIFRFIASAGWQCATRTPLLGDASTRSYEWLERAGAASIQCENAPSAFLMNWPQIKEQVIKNGRTYRQLASLAESVMPFLAVGSHLRKLGLSAPDVYAADGTEGLVLLEDLGEQSFGDINLSGADMTPHYEAATGALARLQAEAPPAALPLGENLSYSIPLYTVDICRIEVDLLTAWAWPAAKGGACPPQEIETFRRLWADLFATLGEAQTLMLRDFHSPNLLWLPKRQGAARVGIIDHQDACLAHAAYDVVSLGQDARVDISPSREAMIIECYLRQMPGILAMDESELRRSYAVFGAQRAVRLIGLFVRLHRQDGKPQYLAHLPRVADYLDRNLAHPALGPLKTWIENHFGTDFTALITGMGGKP